MSRASKVDHVRRAEQTREHTCHWPNCPRQVKPAMWGCREHWFTLPRAIRDRIWLAYQPGQEDRGDPSTEYVEAVRAAMKWVATEWRRTPAPPQEAP